MKRGRVHSILDIAEQDWDCLANTEGGNPFLQHRFFRALELSGSASPHTGWLPQHSTLHDEMGKLVGIAPSYLKNHSYGEYVFDQGWAEAFMRAGGQYYPKLQCAVPFTPVTGPRLLANSQEIKKQLAQGLIDQCAETHASSVHITFLTAQDQQLLTGPDWLERQDIQFHWLNNQYQDFDGFLQNLASSKRKNIRKERRSVADNGITFEWITGSDLKEHHWDIFFQFYQDTGERKWGTPYLNRKFFSLLNETMAADILLIFAKLSQRYIAGALNFMGNNTLYGRNWGALESIPFLHFETCYYQAIDFAIQHKLHRVEAGAQGEHKLARGYLAEKTYSLHHFRHHGLSAAVADYLDKERLMIEENQTLLNQHSPFRRSLS